ncbi:MAG: hypothetical protein JWR19_3326 [Pedosphaera sp.]|nr:hypothetical protein [Pedosphaera sp.]
MAAVLTTLACYPRLTSWSERTNSASFLCLLMLWSTFVLWSFVLGWHFKYTGQHPLAFKRQPSLWGMATVSGLVAAILLRLILDPQLRIINPGDYPANWQSWLSNSLFNLALDPLFLCFAPFAFFIRLAHRQTTALMLTITLGLFILYLKLSSSPVPLAPWLLLALMGARIAGGFLFVYAYLKGGVWLVWWLVLLLQLRHLVGLPGIH